MAGKARRRMITDQPVYKVMRGWLVHILSIMKTSFNQMDVNENGDLETRLWNYIDGNTSDEERMQVDVLLRDNPVWQNTYQQLLHLDQLVKNDLQPEGPSMRFAKNTMEEIAKTQIAPATKTYINKRIVNGITAFFLVVISGLVVFSFAQASWHNTINSKPLFDLSKLHLHVYLNKQLVNTFLMINLVLGLLLVDGVLLRKRNRQSNSPDSKRQASS